MDDKPSWSTDFTRPTPAAVAGLEADGYSEQADVLWDLAERGSTEPDPFGGSGRTHLVDGRGVWADSKQELAVVAFAGRLAVGWVDTAWQGACDPFPRLESVTELAAHASWAEISGALGEAADARRRALQLCRYCGTLNEPGHMDEPDVCQGCASKHLGVVY